MTDYPPCEHCGGELVSIETEGYLQCERCGSPVHVRHIEPSSGSQL